jgi:hypothetical protein
VIPVFGPWALTVLSFTAHRQHTAMYALTPSPFLPPVFKLSGYLLFFTLLCPPFSSLFSYQKSFFPFDLVSSIISKDYYQRFFPPGVGVREGEQECFRILAFSLKNYHCALNKNTTVM